MRTEISHLKTCWACTGTGLIFGGLNPLRFAECIACWGSGYRGKITVPARTIQIHNVGVTADAPSHTFSITEFSENSLLAHVMAKAGIFPSVSRARKNGWDKPIEVGTWLLTKKKIRVTVTE